MSRIIALVYIDNYDCYDLKPRVLIMSRIIAMVYIDKDL